MFTGGIRCTRLGIGPVRLHFIQRERDALQANGFIIVMGIIDCRVFRIVLVQLEACLKGRVHQTIGSGNVLPCSKLLDGFAFGRIRRQNVHIDVIPVTAIAVGLIIPGGDLHGVALALIAISIVWGADFREFITVGILPQDDGLPQNNIGIGFRPLAIGVED